MLSQALKQRGYKVVNQGTEADVLLPKADAAVLQSLKETLYFLMRKETFRKGLRDWAYGSQKSKNVIEVITAYITLCAFYDKNFLNVEKSEDERILKYAHTFEWYISELMKREFGAKASGFNIRLAELNPDDEFDCIALIDDGLVFIECKTGRGELLPEVKKFVRRDDELAAVYSFFIFDRDYTFTKEDKEDLPDIKASEARKLELDSIDKISAARAVFYGIVSGGRYFLATSGFDNLEKRLRLMMRYTYMKNGNADVKKIFTETRISFAKD